MATGEGARGAAALLAGAELRGGARPEMAILGLPGVKKDEIWVGRDDRGVREPPGHLSGHGKTLSGANSYGGGSGRRRSPGWRVPGSEAAYSLRPQVQKEKGPCLCSPRVLVGRSRSAGRPATQTDGGAGAELVVQTAQGSPGLRGYSVR